MGHKLALFITIVLNFLFSVPAYARIVYPRAAVMAQLNAGKVCMQARVWFGDPSISPSMFVCVPAVAIPDSFCIDADGDTYLEGEDCDDTDPSVFPGAEEHCDGIDNDCDGNIDEDDAVDATTWYQDVDGDGFGDAYIVSVACSAPTGYILDASDCDDLNVSINPLAVEYCDGMDNDCDGVVDDASIDGNIYYLDADGDGYGDENNYIDACEIPSGYVSDNTDCDDSDFDANPSGTEVYGDGIDQDCSGYDIDNLHTGDLVITEIMARGYSADYDWFEVFVTAEHEVDLTDSSFASHGGDRFYLPDGLVLESGTYYVFEGVDDATPFDGTTWSSTFSLDVHDEIIIYNYAGYIVDEVEYGGSSSWPLDYYYVSMSLDPDRIDKIYNDSPGYWCYATSTYLGYSSTDRGTPGYENDECAGVYP